MRLSTNLLALTFALATLPLAAQQTPADDHAKVNQLVMYLLERYGLVAEAANESRGDQQLSAPSGTGSSTTVAEKAGIADLLAIAIDRGAIQKKSSGTSVTLSTTPYGVRTAFGMPDNDTNWKLNRWQRKLSFSSTFSSEDVAKGDFSSFEGAEVKYVVLGNRSGRDLVLQGKQELDFVTTFINNADKFEYTECTQPLIGSLGEQRAPQPAHNDVPESGIGEQALKALPAKGFDPTTKTALDAIFADYDPDPATRVILQRCVTALDRQSKADESARTHLTTITKAYLKSANKLQLSVAGLFQRDPTLSDFYEFKVLTDYNPSAGSTSGGEQTSMTANLNGQVDFNSHRSTSSGTSIHQLRSWSVEGAANTPRILNQKLDATLSVKGTRAKDAGARTSAIAQAKVNLHINGTLTLPIGISYANRETDTIKKGLQFNIGFNALLDKFLSTR